MAKSVTGAETERAWAAAVGASLLSGAAALVYQVLWTRLLGLALGTTTAAVAVVLAVFMGGLGLGAALAARRVDAVPRDRLPRLYAALEIGIAILAFLVAPLSRAFPALLTALYRDGEGSMALLTVARLLISSIVLLPPAVLMGATLPTLTALVSRGSGALGRRGGLLYAANTVGAIVGSLGAALYLIPGLGMQAATLAAASLNLGAAFLVAWRVKGAPDPARPLAAEPRPAREMGSAKKKRKRVDETSAVATESLTQRIVLLALALSGLGALVNEVAWARSLVLLIGPTAYAFAFVVAAVITGLAVGSALTASAADRLARPGLALGLVEVGAAAACLGVAHGLGHLPVPVAELVRANLARPHHLLFLELAGVAALLAAPSVLFGAAFPLALAALGRRESHPGRALGRALAWNTTGAIAGALLAGFLLLPWLGLQRSLELAAGVHAGAGALVLVAAAGMTRRAWRVVGWAVTPAVAAVALLLPRWDPRLFSGGAYKYAAYAHAADQEGALRAGELLYFREGASATVSVRRLGATLSLAVDGKVDATSSGDMMTQRLLAHLPLALHAAPRRVLVIGYGSGVTAGSALDDDAVAVDAVEISPEVIEASSFFDGVNGRPRQSPRLRLVVTDGRNHLLLSRRRYDVIVSEPSNPWMAGVSGLFTRDFFRLGRERLTPGGLFCQWIHVYNLHPEDLKTVVGSFTDAFPSAALFELNEGDVLLVGAREGFPTPSATQLEDRLAHLGSGGALQEDGPHRPARPGGVPNARVLASLFTLGGPALAEFARAAARHTDDRPILEWRAARSLWAETAGENHRQLGEAAARARTPEPFASLLAALRPDDLVARGALLERAHSFSWAFEAFRGALALDHSLLAAHEGLVRCAVKTDRAHEAALILDSLLAKVKMAGSGGLPDAGAAATHIGRALLAHNQDDPETALRLLGEALRQEPRSTRALLLAAEVQAQAGNAVAVTGLARRALLAAPEDGDAAAFLAWSLLAAGQKDAAAVACRSLLDRHPGSRRGLEVCAMANAELGRVTEARALFRRLVDLEPEGAGYLSNFGIFELRAGDPRAAAALFERAVEVDPASKAGWEGLREASQAAGDDARLARAERVLRSRRP